jgi:hypothetical protein
MRAEHEGRALRPLARQRGASRAARASPASTGELVLFADAAQRAARPRWPAGPCVASTTVLAGRTQVARQRQPVLVLDLVAARADQLAEHDCDAALSATSA